MSAKQPNSRRAPSKVRTRQEIEIKLRVADPAALRLCLKRLRARKIIPRTFESNILYDTPLRNLIRRGQLIRIRNERPFADGGKKRPIRAGRAILTFKGPPRTPRGSQTKRRERNDAIRFKIREEIELAISSGEQMGEVLQALGLRPTFRYEKFRTTYTLPGISGLKVEFDETPVGLFLELEGNAAQIDRAAKLLGYTRTDYIAESYGALYIADCRRRGRKPTHMVFQQKKLR